MNKETILLGAIIFLIVGVIIGYFGQLFFNPTGVVVPQNQVNLNACPEITQPPLEDNWLTFSDPSWPDLSFKYPKNWAYYGFAKFAEAGLDPNSYRTLSVSKIILAKNQTLQQYLDQKHKECIKTEPVIPEWGQPVCDFDYKIDVSKLQTMNLNGHTAYRTGVRYPMESGENQDRVYLQTNDGYYLFEFTFRNVLGTEIFDQVLKSVEIKP
ncbi:MAG: hypothetical protein NTX00_03890 [Candidatus Parcubacteria bacterium]|nr:hypothetical protein [Candidatus Parcubacteria bacterium]